MCTILKLYTFINCDTDDRILESWQYNYYWTDSGNPTDDFYTPNTFQYYWSSSFLQTIPEKKEKSDSI